MDLISLGMDLHFYLQNICFENTAMSYAYGYLMPGATEPDLLPWENEPIPAL
jgi:hypothetical protein